MCVMRARPRRHFTASPHGGAQLTGSLVAAFDFPAVIDIRIIVSERRTDTRGEELESWRRRGQRRDFFALSRKRWSPPCLRQGRRAPLCRMPLRAMCECQEPLRGACKGAEAVQ